MTQTHRVVVLAATCLLQAACSRPDATETTPAITIWWAQWTPADGLAELGRDFEAENGIAVKVQQIPWAEYQTKVFQEFGSRTTSFDIVVGDSQWLGRGATRGLYLDLTDWLPGAVDLDAIHLRAVKFLCEYPSGSGRYYAAPCQTDATGFMYRKDWFQDPVEKAAFEARYGRPLEVPATWTQLAEVAEFFTRPDQKRYGLALLTGRGYDSLTMGFQQIMWAFGGSWGDPDTFTIEGHLNSPSSVEALSFMIELVRKFAPPGGVNVDYGRCVELLTNGSCAMSCNYFAFAPGIQEAMGRKVGFFPIPMHNGQRYVSLGGQGFSISTKVSPNQQELAKRFIAWFNRVETQKQWITKPAGFTAHEGILRSAEFTAATAYNGPFAESLDSMQDFWNVPVYNKLLAAAQQHLGAALDGHTPATEALNAIATEHTRIMRDAGFGTQPADVAGAG